MKERKTGQTPYEVTDRFIGGRCPYCGCRSFEVTDERAHLKECAQLALVGSSDTGERRLR